MKETLFIEIGEKLYVPRPTSVNAGMARSSWIRKTLNKDSIIVSPEYWEQLVKTNKVQKLVENGDSYLILELQQEE